MASPLAGDPLEQHFDRGVGLVGYALLFVSAFFFGVPGIVAAALAFAHKLGPSPLMDSHFRFQLQIFWTCVALFAVALIAAVAAAILGVVELAHYLPFDAQGLRQGLGLSEAQGAASAGGLVVLAVILALASGAWSLAAPAYGFFKLIGGRPIGRPYD